VLVAAMMEMYLQGVSTRKVKTMTEELCGHLVDHQPHCAARRNVLAVELASRESASSWKELLISLRQRSLNGVEFVVSDDHAGLRHAIQEVLSEAVWQRCYVPFLRNALDYLPRKADDDCLQELRWIYDRRDVQEARQDLTARLAKWGKRYAKLCAWVEDNIEETFSFYRLPRQHHKNSKSTNMLERFIEDFKRRTLVVRIFPNAAACLRLIRAWPPKRTRIGSKPCSTSTWNR
jgi:putative transposase